MFDKNNSKNLDFGYDLYGWKLERAMEETCDSNGEDMVNSPSHYTRGRYEAIDIIEDAIKDAPSTMAGMCQGTALKYLLRLWHKADAKEDAEKARWYLNKLIDSLK